VAITHLLVSNHSYRKHVDIPFYTWTLPQVSCRHFLLALPFHGDTKLSENIIQDLPPNWIIGFLEFYALPHCIPFFSQVSDKSKINWTVHHLDSWIKIDQLDVTCFIISLFTAQHVSNISTSIFRSLQLIVDLFHVLYGSVRIEVLALVSFVSGEWLVVTCVVVLISVFL